MVVEESTVSTVWLEKGQPVEQKVRIIVRCAFLQIHTNIQPHDRAAMRQTEMHRGKQIETQREKITLHNNR